MEFTGYLSIDVTMITKEGEVMNLRGGGGEIGRVGGGRKKGVNDVNTLFTYEFFKKQ